MPRLIGDRFLPDTVSQRRQQLRERVLDLREPVRRRRVDMVPGPNILGQIEGTMADLRDRFVTRDAVVSNIMDRRNNDEEENDTNNEENAPQSRGRSGDREAVV